MKMHNLLKRQLRKTLGNPKKYSPEIQSFIKKVNDAYHDFDNDRDLLERSLEITSKELVDKFEKLKEDNAKLIQAREELQEKEKKLRYSLREKEALLAEIHHRVKNNLATVNGLLFLQMEMEADPQLSMKLHEAHQRVQTMAMIHEMLYQSKSFSSIPINDYLKELINSIKEKFQREHQSIEIEIRSQNLLLNLETALPISLLVNEIITNSLRYAFTDKNGGKIKIELETHRTDKQIILTITDNGKGIPQDVSLDNPKTLGILLIHTFLKQLDGTMETHTNKGTFFRFTIPLK